MKTLQPIQIAYARQQKVLVEKELQTRTNTSASWTANGFSTVSTNYSYGGQNFASSTVVYPTTTKTTAYGGWNNTDSLNRYRLKTHTTDWYITLIQFDYSQIKPGKQYFLNLYATGGGSATAYPDVYKITESWDKSTVTFTKLPAMTKVLSSQSLPLGQWVQIDVTSALSTYGIALRDEGFGTGTDRHKELPKTGTYAPHLSGAGSSGVWVQTASGIKQGGWYEQTASGLVAGSVNVMTANGMKESS